MRFLGKISSFPIHPLTAILTACALAGCAQEVRSGPPAMSSVPAPSASPTAPVTSSRAFFSAPIHYGPLGGRSYLTNRELAALPLHVRVHFATNSARITPYNAHIIAENAKFLLKFPKLSVLVEGNCDQRGTQEYNLALGWRRARAVQRYLEIDGVSASRIRTTSFGKDNLLCYSNTPACWARNRRADFVYQPQKDRIHAHSS